MAVVNSPEEEEELKKAEDKGDLMVGGEGAAYSAAPSAASGGGSPGSASAGAGAPPSSFVNLQKYMDTNKEDSSKLAQDIGAKAQNEFTAANENIGKLENDALSSIAAGTKKDTLSQKIGSDASSLTAADKNAINSVKAGYGGPNALSDVSSYNNFESAYNQGVENAKQYTDQSYQKAVLDDMFNTSEIKSQIGGYGSGMRNLDASLLSSQSGVIQDAIDSTTKSVQQKKSDIEKAFEKQKADAVKNSNAAWDSIKASAEASRKNLQAANDAEIAAKNKSLDLSKYIGKNIVDKGTGASYGDVLDERELAAAGNLDSILGGSTFGNYNKTYRDVVAEDLPRIEVIQPAPTTTPPAPGTIRLPLPVFPEGGVDNTDTADMSNTIPIPAIPRPGGIVAPLPIGLPPDPAPPPAAAKPDTRLLNKYLRRAIS